MTERANRFAVLGSPIGHSKSPAIHRAAYEVLNNDWSYGAVDLTADKLDEFLESRDESWRGFSLTMPLKERAFEIAEERDRFASQSGVVNTLLRTTTGWRGFNTDIPGLHAALSEAGLDLTHTVVLGAGATAVSAVLAVQLGGAERVTVLARREEASKQLGERFGCESGTFGGTPRIIGATTVISTLPGTVGDSIDLPSGMDEVPLFDVAYHPWPSPLSTRWTSRGTQATSGLAMLLFQAVYQIRIFSHGTPDRALSDETRVLAAMRRVGMEE